MKLVQTPMSTVVSEVQVIVRGRIHLCELGSN